MKKLIPSGLKGSSGKVVIQGGEAIYCIILSEDNTNLFVKDKNGEFFIRKNYIESLEYILSKDDLTKSLSNCTEERSKPKNDFSYSKWWNKEAVQEAKE